jgi:hypothetical protein
MTRILLVLCIFCLAATMSLAGGRPPKDEFNRPMSPPKDSNQESGKPHTTPSAAPMPPDRVRVYKPDGSLQCAMGRVIPLDEMAKELIGLAIYRSEKRMDGLVRIMQCGTPTGMCNVYEIDRGALQKAIELGFREWTFADSP